MARALWLLTLLLLATTALVQPAAADEEEEPAAAEPTETDGDDDSDDEDDDQNCGADIGDGEGNGPSLEEHGITELAEAASDPRSLVLGWRQYGDCLLFRKTVRRRKGFGRLNDVDVLVDREANNVTITHVVARPAADAAGALRAERRGGGVGRNWVHLKLRAPRGFALHYDVQVFGR